MITVNYDAAAAVRYARKYAQAPEDMRIFYTASGSDCTNFISQCIWAGYGGYSDDLALTRERIRLRFRMAKGVWHGDDGGGTHAWEQVDKLFAFCIGPKSIGPNAAAYNDGAAYYRLPADSIKKGDVLQFRYGNTGKYQHSVMVTGRSESGIGSGFSPYDGILVCQHTRDVCDRNLWDLIVYFGGSDCHMRKMSFTQGNFLK